MTTTTVKLLSPMQQKLLKLVLKPVSYFNTWLYRTSGGKLGGKAAGAPVMLTVVDGVDHLAWGDPESRAWPDLLAALTRVTS